METLFWLSIAFVAYVYAGYPVLLTLWARLRGDAASARQARDGDALPPVTVIIAARDEALRLPARIDNLLDSDYPADRLEIIIASDGSTDDTAGAIAPYTDRVKLLLLPPSGKAGALNRAVREASHPILVFADARQRFARDAIRLLVSHFEDPAIGAVSGELVLDCEPATRDRLQRARDAQESGEAAHTTGSTSTIADGIGAYWQYEKWVRRHEALVGSPIGVTGAIYAMRRWLWRPLPADTILDDVLVPMRVVLGGHRVAFDGRARAYDQTAGNASAELRRKSRTLAGNYQLLAREPMLLVPFVNPVWLQFVSHKVARLLVPYALLGAFVASAALAAHSALYATALLAQLALYGLAAYGAVLDRRRAAPAAGGEVFREAA
jgi:cellulose synthase/poly-beta-1,6-N-acetylglucosamine synthase-like glycosyltransferase